MGLSDSPNLLVDLSDRNSVFYQNRTQASASIRKAQRGLKIVKFLNTPKFGNISGVLRDMDDRNDAAACSALLATSGD
jgi:hypothetical protein